MRLFLLIIATSISFSALHSQVYDSVEFKKIRINGFFLGSKKADLVRKFGEPHKIVTTESSRGTDAYSDYSYSKSTLRVNPDGVFYGFKLTENEFVLGWGRYIIKPGDSLKEFAINFPQSFKSYTKQPGGKFKIKIRASNTYIVFKIKDGVIDEIETKEEIL
ncbi:MAG: hypothetical protein V4557_09555 [Bacteroidota bacterium]